MCLRQAHLCDADSFQFGEAVQVNHPANRLLRIPRVENILRRPISNQLQLALVFLDLHLDVIDLIEASLVLEVADLRVVFADVLP